MTSPAAYDLRTEQPTLALVDDDHVDTSADMRGELAAGRRRSYVLAGRAIVTIRSPKTGVRFTFKITKSADAPDRPAVHFVSVLTGADSEYSYLGTLFATGFRSTRKSRINPTAPSFVAFAWFAANLESPKLDAWHEGSCGRCGRRLTVPESIVSGLGPVCAGRE